MSGITSERAVESRQAASAPTYNRSLLVLTAWASTLLISNLPLVIARDILGTDIPWIAPAWVGAALLLVAASTAWQALRPLRGYFIIMGLIMLLDFVVNPWVIQSALVQNMLSGQPEIVSVLAHRVLLVLRASIVVAALFLMGVKRRDAFLTLGNLSAPVGGQAAATRRRRLTWPVLGTVMSLLLGGMFFMFLSTQSPAMLSNISAVVPWIPIILLSAALNALGEEVEYRAAPLATLLPVVGPTQSILLTSLWFGLGHYYGGIPSGVFALVYVSLLALLLGKAMVDTRGLGWSWIIHITIDTVIYIFIATLM